MTAFSHVFIISKIVRFRIKDAFIKDIMCSCSQLTSDINTRRMPTWNSFWYIWNTFDWGKLTSWTTSNNRGGHYRDQKIFTSKRSRYQRLGLFALCWSNAEISPSTLEMTSPLKHLPHLAFKEEQPSSSNSKLLEVTSRPHAVDLVVYEHLCTTWLRLFRQTGPGISFRAACMSSPSELLLELELVEGISLDSSSATSAASAPWASCSKGVVGTQDASPSSQTSPVAGCKGGAPASFSTGAAALSALHRSCSIVGNLHEVNHTARPRLIRSEVILSDVCQHAAVELQRSGQHVPWINCHSFRTLQFMVTQQSAWRLIQPISTAPGQGCVLEAVRRNCTLSTCLQKFVCKIPNLVVQDLRHKLPSCAGALQIAPKGSWSTSMFSSCIAVNQCFDQSTSVTPSNGATKGMCRCFFAKLVAVLWNLVLASTKPKSCPLNSARSTQNWSTNLRSDHLDLDSTTKIIAPNM